MQASVAEAVQGRRFSSRGGTDRQQRVVQHILTVVVILLVALPLVVLLYVSVLPPKTLPFTTLAFDAANFLAIVRQDDTAVLVANTLQYAAGSVGVALLVACTIAWLTERADLPLRRAVRILMFSWMVVPPLVMAFGWILLLNPGNGALNVALKSVFGFADSPLTIYSMRAMIMITGLTLVPTAFVVISGLLRNMDPQLENAALISGAGRSVVVRRITLPLLGPGLLSIAIYLLMVMVQTFEIPLAVGLTARLPMLSTRIFVLSNTSEGVPNYGLAAAFGVLLLAFATILMAGYFFATRQAERFRVVGGKAFRPKRIALGRLRWLCGVGVGLYFLVMMLPLLILLWTSLLPFYQTPSIAAVSALSFAKYADVLSQNLVVRAITNTVVLVIFSGTIVMLLSSIISWYAVRGKGRVGKLLETAAFVPIAIPHVIMAVALLVLYLRTPIYGTIWLLILGHITIYLAFGTRTMNSALLQIHQELENAASVSGASWGTRLRRIILPIIWPQFINGWLWVVAHSARDVTIPLILMTSSNVVVASLLWLMWEYPNVPGAAALSMLLLLGQIALVVPVQIYANRESDSRFSQI
jgi:iron(III) transport system permease protein